MDERINCDTLFPKFIENSKGTSWEQKICRTIFIARFVTKHRIRSES